MQKIFLLLFSISIVAQQGSSYYMEILPQTKGFESDYEQIIFKIQPLSIKSYCEYQFAWVEETANAAEEIVFGNYINPGGLPGSKDFGFDVCYSNDGYPKFWLAFNKIVISYYLVNDFYFYIDYRDCGYGYGRNDITIRFVKNDGYYISPDINLNPTLNGFFQINLGDVFRIGEINSYSSFSTQCIPNFWQNCLVLIPSPANHPRLVWGPHPTFSATHYRIYRAVSNYPVNPSSLTYSLISTVSSSTFDFIDYAVTILPDYQYAYYYVVGWNGTVQSDKTNYASTQAEFQKHLMDVPADFSISQNYPNPFNPSTSISYSIPENAFVALKIYDVLGNEVEVLINEQKEPGNYQIDFNASELSSGIYYYTLTEGNFTSTKKMILVK